MRKIHILIIALLVVLPLVGAGCISIRTSKTVDGGVFRSDDSGENWVQKVFIRQEKKKVISINNANIGTMVFHPDDKNIIYLGTLEDGLYRSKDRGEQWESFGLTSGSFATISIDPKTPTIVYTATGSSILKTSDDGQTWETIYLEPRNQKITSVNVDLYDPSRVFASTFAGEIIQSTDYGETWTTLSSIQLEINRLYLNPIDTRIIYAVTNGQGIYRSTNAGENWESLNTDLVTHNGATIINWLDFTDKDPGILYLATNYGLFKSSNGGIDWEPITTLFSFGSVPIKTVAVNPDNQSEIWFTIGKIVHKTTDASATWKTIETVPSNRTITILEIDPENPQTLYAGTFTAKKK